MLSMQCFKGLIIRLYTLECDNIDIPIKYIKYLDIHDNGYMKMKVDKKFNENSRFDELLGSVLVSVNLIHMNHCIYSQMISKDRYVKVTKKGNLVICTGKVSEPNRNYADDEVRFNELDIPRTKEEIEEYNARFLREFGFPFYKFDDTKTFINNTNHDPSEWIDIEVSDYDLKYLRAKVAFDCDIKLEKYVN